MEFKDRIKKIREENSLTQEDLAEILYVSRTAISKWENGKGYPNIDSLKKISEIYSISLDDLLNTSKAIDLYEKENKNKLLKLKLLFTGAIDVGLLLLLVLPLYGVKKGSYIYMESLLSNGNHVNIRTFFFFSIPIIMAFFGLLEIIIAKKEYIESDYCNKVLRISLEIQIVFVSIYIMINEPYATLFFFLFLIAKFIVIKRL